MDPTEEEREVAQATFAVIQWEDKTVQIHKEPHGAVPFPVLMKAVQSVGGTAASEEAEPMVK